VRYSERRAYDRGHTDGRKAGFGSGEIYGRSMQRMQDAHRPLVGAAIGLVLGAVIQPLVFWLKGICF
jgi:hypothetical protein